MRAAKAAVEAAQEAEAEAWLEAKRVAEAAGEASTADRLRYSASRKGRPPRSRPFYLRLRSRQFASVSRGSSSGPGWSVGACGFGATWRRRAVVLCRTRREAAIDMRAMLHRQSLVMHVAFHARALENDELAGVDRTLHRSGQPRALRRDRAFDAARSRLGRARRRRDRRAPRHRRAGRPSLDVALDDDVGADHRKVAPLAMGFALAFAAPRSGRSARASSRTWGAVSRKGRGFTARS